MSTVGWANIAEKAALAYPPPTKYLLAKDESAKGLNFLSCPAVRSVFEHTYVVNSPFSMRFRAAESGGFLSIAPIYPFTSLSEKQVKKIVRFHPRPIWRKPNLALMQIIQPFLFFADEHIQLEQLHPTFGRTESLNWQVVPGKFDIYAWHRVISLAIEWDVRCGDLVIRTGDPLYLLRFQNSDNKPQVNLVQHQPSPQLLERTRQFKGIVEFRRGALSLIGKAEEMRQGMRLVDYHGEI